MKPSGVPGDSGSECPSPGRGAVDAVQGDLLALAPWLSQGPLCIPRRCWGRCLHRGTTTGSIHGPRSWGRSRVRSCMGTVPGAVRCRPHTVHIAGDIQRLRADNAAPSPPQHPAPSTAPGYAAHSPEGPGGCWARSAHRAAWVSGAQWAHSWGAAKPQAGSAALPRSASLCLPQPHGARPSRSPAPHWGGTGQDGAERAKSCTAPAVPAAPW